MAWQDIPESDSPASASAPLSVSAAVALAKGALEGVVVRMVGEVSEVSDKAGYKAVYFTLKDKAASLPCMMWNNRYRASGVQVRVGSLVEVTGRFTLYAAKGRMNFDVFSIAIAGEGDLRLQVANVAKKLAAEGLMDPARKRALPPLPETVGLVTSPRGAAVHDVLRTLRRRFPMARVLLAGVAVEGAGAAEGIAEGIRCVCAAGAEAVLVVRGGGSFEDLMPFNDEALARVIAACPVPVVTGIGHEPDTTIADMVADVRASTPTAAAEAASPSHEGLDAACLEWSRRLSAAAARTVGQGAAAADRLAVHPIFKDPAMIFAQEAQAIDYACDRLARAIPACLARNEARADELARWMRRSLPQAASSAKQAIDAAQRRMLRAGGTLAAPFDQQMRLCAARLHDLSPLAVLGRGYAVARTEEGAIVKCVGQAPAGSRIEVAVSDGVLACCVEGSHANAMDGFDMEESDG